MNKDDLQSKESGGYCQRNVVENSYQKEKEIGRTIVRRKVHFIEYRNHCWTDNMEVQD